MDREIYNKGYPDLEMTDNYVNLLCVIADNIERIRIKKGFTVENVVQLGFDRRFYQRLESGKRSMNLRTLFKLSRLFRIDICEFFKPIEKKSYKKIPSNSTFEEIKEVIDYNRSLSHI